MRDFVFLIADERRRQPSLMLVSTGSDERAREIAERMLTESPHRTNVEVWEDSERLFTVHASGPGGQEPSPPAL